VKKKTKVYIALHILLLLVSLSAVCSKFASQCEFLSLRYCIFQAGMIGLLGIYAIGWVQVIKHIDLTTAYMNKAVSVFWGIVWSLVIFKESLNLGQVAGAVLVIAGVILFAKADGEEKEGIHE